MRPHSAFNGARWPRYHSTKMPQSLSESDALAAQLQVSTLKAANQLKIESSSIEEDNESSLATDASPKAIAVFNDDNFDSKNRKRKDGGGGSRSMTGGRGNILGIRPNATLKQPPFLEPPNHPKGNLSQIRRK